MPCNCCEITDQTFGEESAQADARSYRKRGPAGQTRLILQAIRGLDLREAELLDIGGGIGVIHHELLEDVARKALHVDASSAYLKEAEAEAVRRGHGERVSFIHADFTEVAPELPQADVVTLDRVVCCYPDFRRLLSAASAHSRRALALTYPRETWYTRLGFKVLDFFQKLRKDPFRVFLHPVAQIDALLRSEGFERVSRRRLLVWEMALYRRITI